MITYQNVTKKYGDTPIIEHLDLSIPEGQFVVLIGPSGCGKTTTLKMLNRLIEADEGEILVNGQNIKKMNEEKLRRNIGYVIQQIGLFPNMTVAQNITVVPRLLKWDKERCQARVKELMKLVDLPFEEYAHKYPSELSGGQQQRVGILRALAAEPPIVLMDEPFSALDPITRDTLQDEVRALQKRLGLTVIFVTHDMNEAIKMADTIIFMHKGKVLQMASPEEMLRAPANDIIREFMSKHVNNYMESPGELLCEDLMKRRVAKVTQQKKTLECVAIMSNWEIDSLIVVDDDGKFEGVVTIEALKKRGRSSEDISEVVKRDVPTVQVDTPAKNAFDILISKQAEYVVVLYPDHRVAGIITRTSMSKALATAVWGEVQ